MPAAGPTRITRGHGYDISPLLAVEMPSMTRNAAYRTVEYAMDECEHLASVLVKYNPTVDAERDPRRAQRARAHAAVDDVLACKPRRSNR